MSGYIAPGAPSKLDRSQIASLHGGAPSKFWKAEPTTIPQPSPQPASNPNPYSKAYHGSGNFTRHSDVFTRNAPPSTSSSQISLRRRRPSGSSLHLSAGTRPSGATSETLRRPFDALVDGDELDPLNMGAFEQSRSSRSALDKGKQKASPEDEDEVMLVESSAVSAPPTHSRKRKSGDEDYPFLDMLSVMKTRSDRKKAEQAKMKEIRTAAIANEKPLDKFRFNPRSSPAPAPPASRPVSSRPDLLPIRILFWGLIKHEANSSPDVPKVLSWPQNHPAFSLRQAHSPAPGQKPLIVVPMKCVRHFEYFSGSSQIPPYLHFDIEIDTDNKPTSTSDLFKSDSDTFRPRMSVNVGLPSVY
ncbi:uncharacterized protein EI90DRAFT_2079968 [Cantharellus anzutake]|uniref:uncharacterized protein n=1 Tax=Cantharellus anzutake TaxID=1750568 RepID=UPI00190748C7|nr:uncharacterized protein EI90DRAFT_2079968 [Cantharellus anzutake]KAF8340539.1 hypothetical protein EI90DRAFT_2079968 [Cantharellus anzutake]